MQPGRNESPGLRAPPGDFLCKRLALMTDGFVSARLASSWIPALQALGLSTVGLFRLRKVYQLVKVYRLAHLP